MQWSFLRICVYADPNIQDVWVDICVYADPNIQDVRVDI
jgi:hypothetical protein